MKFWHRLILRHTVRTHYVDHPKVKGPGRLRWFTCECGKVWEL